MSNTTKLEPTGVLFPDSTLQTSAYIQKNPTSYMLATDNSANSMAVALDPGTWLLTLDGRFNDGGGGGYYDASRTANVTNVGGCTVTVHFVVTGDGGHGRYMYASNIATYRFTITGQTANQTLSIGADSGQGGGSNAIAFLTKTS